MRTTRTFRPKTATELHRTWLELVETDGPFLAIPPLKRVWPQGIPALGPERLDVLREARPAFDHAWEALDIDPVDETVQAKYAEVRDVWVQTVLRDVVGWHTSLAWGPDCAPGVRAHSPDRRITVTPQAALLGPDGIGALVGVVDKCDSLHTTGTDGWAATAIDRMEAMLRGAGVAIGIVTDGRWWALVCARPDAMVASGIVDAQTWVEEPLTRNAFLTVVARQYIIGGDPNERLPKLFEESVAAAEEITEALGAQVRRAVELLIQAFAETAADHHRRGLRDPLPDDPHDTYSAAVTVMMRVVFLLFAEERGLLPQSELFLQGYGISGELDDLDQRRLREGEESLDSTYLTWHRLLATSQALYRGASFENMRMPAYGGSLFDPKWYPFLTASSDNGTLALPVSDRVMLHVLRSVQVAQLKGGDARRISFRDVGVEQIGYIYEGLLGYSCIRVLGDTQVGLFGATGTEPKIPLTVLEQLADAKAAPATLAAAIIAWLKENQPAASPPSANALAKRLAATPGNDADRMLRAVTDDEDLRARLLPWATITRPDLRDRPTVILDGGLVVTETPSRRNAGAHYTPKSLAEEVVQHALEPLCYSPGPHQTADRDTWRLRGSDEILNLKVADIAAGSGAFLVAAARYLAARLVEAWLAEDPANAGRHDLGQHAIREVVARCLYGADINAMAVEMCKLSLWLVSLDRDLPFSFVDDKILHGNSLLGLTDIRQVRTLHIEPAEHGRALPASLDIGGTVRRATEIRRELASEVREFDPQRSATAKRRQLNRLRELTAQLRTAADGVIASGLRLGGRPGVTLDNAYQNLAAAVAAAIPGEENAPETVMLDMIIKVGLTPTVATDYERWQPLHWVLEVPDVVIDHGGFDAIIGNPPFLGGQKLTGAMGTNVRDWFVHQIADGTRGSADLVAYFLLRAVELLRPSGTLGLIATNTIAQGDTRQVGLERIAANGFTITRAVQSAPWPSASANLEYAAVWGGIGPVTKAAHRVADGVVVPRISTLLEPAGQVDGTPAKLTENEDIAFQGCIVLGMGFVLEPEEAQAWITENKRNADVVFPYLNGEDLNSRPDGSASRWVIDFTGYCVTCAARLRQPFDRIEQLVKPERMRNTRAARRDRWWQFAEIAPGLRRAIAGLDEVLVIALVSKSVMPARVPTGQVFSHKLGVFATNSFADQAVLSSSLHQMWAIKYGSTMRADVNYSPSDVFMTFPRIEPTARLDEVGRTLDVERREIMLRRGLGLTRLYNLVNESRVADGDDAEVARLRQIHVELDEVVMAAYGWSDVPLDHGFHTYRQMERWTVSPAARVEILDRLLAENLRRAAAQQPKAAKKATGRQRKPAVHGDQETLL
ncbi:Eco57I restriction-modification methylase domain-containing protein [Micromonospora sp. RL09-050-HVF-A]|uniref:Eco57I restriction-modification methylase domain-containing protein n=1 Tax=Micromonospora sp. RL09-050-HVF-A TaxID=1703433 RepID=UPI001C5E0506|nr:DNA methyltransferase [Micromonospora sp. RL09-050-HVF-A]MBW4705182.1 SAM-dependent DNA methyltransferase [Micromonospora sp. RL09-050-HVF-A]